MSFLTGNLPVQILVPNDRTPLAGIVTTPMPLLAFVKPKASTAGVPQDAVELVSATGGGFALLEAQVMSDADWQSYRRFDPQWLNEIRMPVPVNSGVSARFARVIAVEDAALFDGIDATTAAETAVTMVAGQFGLYDHTVPPTGANEIVGYLERLETPLVAGNFRWVIRLVAA